MRSGRTYMSTTVDLSEQELNDLKVYTKRADASEAVRSAMMAYLRFARRIQLKEMSGQVQMEETWQTLEGLELRDRDGVAGIGNC
jgi:hypothetical protein